MENDPNTVSYGHTGYDTWEDEATARFEQRESFRRRLLAGIRGRLREKRGLRWWLAWVMLICAAVAWLVAVALHSTGAYGWLWLPGWGVLASWPIYVLALKLRAISEAAQLLSARDWHFLKATDEKGDADDLVTEEHIERILNQAWQGERYGSSNDGGLAGFLLLIIVTVGTWLIWDLLRMGPALMAEIILDGQIVPANPSLLDRLPTSEPWYKTALLNTGLHFITLAALAVGIRFIIIICAHHP
jgi:hypothetical protein